MAFRVLVTGGAGYVGRHVIRALRAAGCEPVWLDLRPTSEAEGLISDMRQAADLTGAIKVLAPNGVIHLAAHSSVAESVANPDKYVENVAMCENLRRAAEGLPIVLASSAAVYGEGGPDPIWEGRRVRPANPYGQSKVWSEAALPGAVALRLFNVAGGDGDGGDHILPRIAQACLSGSPLTINGDGMAGRDFVHVEDVARAFVAAVLGMTVGVRPQALNICAGKVASPLDLVDVCRRISGRQVDVRYGPFRAGDVKCLVGCPIAARHVLGWSAARSLDDMVASALVAADVAEAA